MRRRCAHTLAVGALAFLYLSSHGSARAEDGGVTFAQVQRLATEYGCPAADAPIILDGGFRLESPDRAARNDCVEGRAVVEALKWRDLADAGTWRPAQSQTLYLVSTIACTATAVFTAYANNRTARRLGLLP